jgi:hypothetical protein
LYMLKAYNPGLQSVELHTSFRSFGQPKKVTAQDC